MRWMRCAAERSPILDGRPGQAAGGCVSTANPRTGSAWVRRGYITAMSREPGANEPAAYPAKADSRNDSQSSTPRARPPRPDMSDSTPAPVRRLSPPTTAVRVARWLWLASLTLGVIAGFFVFLSRADQLERLRALVIGLDATLDSETLDAAALIVFWGALGVLALVFALEAIMLNVMLRGRGGARWALLCLLVFHAGALVLADAALIAPDNTGLYLWILLLVQLVLASAGLVFSLLPGPSRWFRAEHKRRSQQWA